MKLNVAIQMDHVSTIDIDGDSTFVLGLEAERRGYAVWHYTPPDLIFRDRKVMARAQPMKLRREKGNHFTLGAAEMLDLSTLDVVLLRQDPPFDMSYITTTHILEHIHPRTLVVNDPASVRNAPEKLFVTHFDNVMPPTLISADAARHPRLPRRAQGHHPEAAVRQWRRRRVPRAARRRELQFAAGDVLAAQPRAGDRPALPAGGAQGRQAHHPDRRQGGRRHQPRAGRGRGALEHACRRRGGEGRRSPSATASCARSSGRSSPGAACSSSAST